MFCFVLMIRRPPRFTRTDTLIPYTTLFRSQEENWIKRFNAQADVGCYLRVVEPGAVAAGDVVRVISRPDHGVLVRHLITGPDRDALVELLAATDRKSTRLNSSH